MAKLTTKQESDYRQIVYELRSWVDDAAQMASHLRRVRDEKLFAVGGYKNFEEFCLAELGYTPQWANQLIRSAEAAASISETIVSETPPANEAQARELAKAPEEKRAEIWDEVVSEGKPTAAKVKAKVAKAKPKISGGDSFDVSEIEAAPATKKPKQGAPTVSTPDRKAASKALGILQRALDKIGLGEKWVGLLSQVEEDIERA